MKKIGTMIFRKYFILPLSILFLSFYGCEKNEVLTFQAKFQDYEVQGGAKVHLDNRTPVWDDGDLIKANSLRGTVTSTGSLTLDGTESGVEGFCMVYPYEIVSGDLTYEGGTVVIPNTQKYEITTSGEQKIKAPMAARATTGTVQFYNICAIVTVNVQNTSGLPIRVESITISGPSKLSGRFPLGYNSVRYELGNATNHGNSMTLDCSEVRPEILHNSSKVFYVYVPKIINAATNNVNISVKTISTTGEYHIYQQSNTESLTVKVNQITPPVPTYVTSSGATGLLYGKFTIDNAGNTVQFTRGNLLYDGSNYSLANSQGYMLGTANVSSQINDLHQGNLPVCITNGTMNVNGLDALRLISLEHIRYIMNNRGDSSTPRFKIARIYDNGYKNGIILFPDGFANNFSGELGSVNEASYNQEGYQLFSDWESAQKCGAVFLPAGGGGRFTENTLSSTDNARKCMYWLCANRSSGTYPYRRMIITKNSFNSTQENETYGCSIRLVKAE